MSVNRERLQEENIHHREHEPAPTTAALAEQVVFSLIRPETGNRKQLAGEMITQMPTEYTHDLGVLTIASQSIAYVDGRQLEPAEGIYWEATKLALRESLERPIFPEDKLLKAMLVTCAAQGNAEGVYVGPEDFVGDENFDVAADQLNIKGRDEIEDSNHLKRMYDLFDNMERANILQHDQKLQGDDPYVRLRLNENVYAAFGDIVHAMYEEELDRAAQSYSKRFFVHTT